MVNHLVMKCRFNKMMQLLTDGLIDELIDRSESDPDDADGANVNSEPEQ